ncbi:type I restriction enzyme HsdR N-terminal domain-containing protein [Parabacteroides sp. OttesenSCG-928-N08]|nr:type I restriction enzyme HsdR N-terminal domain-containing protein [Parabacteroides sp. OttesenSCG-928-N08]
MQPLNLPSFAAKVTTKEGKRRIYDPLRLKYVALTPEEWVRQHFVHFLTEVKQYPPQLMANEVTIKLNNTSKRCDTVLYDSYLSPKMIVEYKAPSVEITQGVFEQIVRYNMVLKVEYLIVTNGLSHYCCRIDYQTDGFQFLSEIPHYTHL